MKTKYRLVASFMALLLLLGGCASGDGTTSSDVSGDSETVSTSSDSGKTTSSNSSQNGQKTSKTPGKTTSGKTTTSTKSNSQWTELFKDGNFERGLKVVSINDRSDRKVLDFGDSARKKGVKWNLVQHFSKYDLITATPVKNSNGSVSYSNPGKRITISKENGENVLQMEMLASKEFAVPRKSGESWPHLLIEQNLGSEPLDTYDQMIFSMSIRKDYIRNVMGDDYNEGLHCYQTGMVLIVQNMNTQSPGYGNDFFWFTIPCFDSRMEYKSAYCNVDTGKADASGKLIYSPGGKEWYDTYYTANPMTNEGKWCTVTVDILPELQKAFNRAQRLGYLGKSNFEDMRVQGCNFGCECTGTFDASVSIKNVSLKCHSKK